MAKINILKYGTNKLRTKQLHYQYKNLSRGQFTQPIVKGKSLRGEKAREQHIRKKLIRKLKRRNVDTSEYEEVERDEKKGIKSQEQRSSVLDEIEIE